MGERAQQVNIANNEDLWQLKTAKKDQECSCSADPGAWGTRPPRDTMCAAPVGHSHVWVRGWNSQQLHSNFIPSEVKVTQSLLSLCLPQAWTMAWELEMSNKHVLNDWKVALSICSALGPSTVMLRSPRLGLCIAASWGRFGLELQLARGKVTEWKKSMGLITRVILLVWLTARNGPNDCLLCTDAPVSNAK